MRSVIVQSLGFAMAGAAVLAFGVAKAGEEASLTLPPGYVAVQENARISSLTPLAGFQVLDADHLLIRTGGRDAYIADLLGNCARGVTFDWTIGIDTPGGGDIDRYSSVIINGRHCAISSLTKVALAPGARHPRARYAHN